MKHEKFELDAQTFSSIFGAKRYVPHEKTNLSHFLRYFKTKDTVSKKKCPSKVCGMNLSLKRRRRKGGKEEGRKDGEDERRIRGKLERTKGGKLERKKGRNKISNRTMTILRRYRNQ